MKRPIMSPARQFSLVFLEEEHAPDIFLFLVSYFQATFCVFTRSVFSLFRNTKRLIFFWFLICYVTYILCIIMNTGIINKTLTVYWQVKESRLAHDYNNELYFIKDIKSRLTFGVVRTKVLCCTKYC